MNSVGSHRCGAAHLTLFFCCVSSLLLFSMCLLLLVQMIIFTVIFKYQFIAFRSCIYRIQIYLSNLDSVKNVKEKNAKQRKPCALRRTRTKDKKAIRWVSVYEKRVCLRLRVIIPEKARQSNKQAKRVCVSFLWDFQVSIVVFLFISERSLFCYLPSSTYHGCATAAAAVLCLRYP